jgi:hypothetical protein
VAQTANASARWGFSQCEGAGCVVNQKSMLVLSASVFQGRRILRATINVLMLKCIDAVTASVSELRLA